ncbi:hypothetical protein SVIOM74S_04298 [Streptomyces violarus]
MSRSPRAKTKAPAATARTVDVKESDGDRRTLTVGAGEASYLQLHENHNKGWKATLNGKELTPLRIDGWQQAWLVPEGEGGTVTLEYEPARIYQAGLIGAGVLFLVLVGLAVVRRKGSGPTAGSHEGSPEGSYEGDEQQVPPGPGLILGTVALTLVGIVIAGPVALVVPVLAVLAHFRPSLLAPVAFAAMAAAGVVVAVTTGEFTATDKGAFGATAQLLALIALFAALVTVGAAPSRGRRRSGRGTEPVAATAGAGDGGGDPTIPLQAAQPAPWPDPLRRRQATAHRPAHGRSGRPDSAARQRRIHRMTATHPARPFAARRLPRGAVPRRRRGGPALRPGRRAEHHPHRDPSARPTGGGPWRRVRRVAGAPSAGADA